MLTQCPSCHARSTLVGEREGAKVRCAECGSVYLARARRWHGARARRVLIGGFVLALSLLLFFFLVASSSCQGQRP